MNEQNDKFWNTLIFCFLCVLYSTYFSCLLSSILSIKYNVLHWIKSYCEIIQNVHINFTLSFFFPFAPFLHRSCPRAVVPHTEVHCGRSKTRGHHDSTSTSTVSTTETFTVWKTYWVTNSHRSSTPASCVTLCVTATSVRESLGRFRRPVRRWKSRWSQWTTKAGPAYIWRPLVDTSRFWIGYCSRKSMLTWKTFKVTRRYTSPRWLVVKMQRYGNCCCFLLWAITNVKLS